MLDKYVDSQPEFCSVVNSMIINNNKISHAYFIETSNCSNKDEIIKDFVKVLLSRKDESQFDNISKLIDNGLYEDLYIINPDGNWIKKEQILSLKEELSNKSLKDNYRIYIINDADKLNVASANSMLKFLEEPSSNIIGILVGDNRYNVINTLLSRCQILKLKSDKHIIYEEELVNDIFDFLMNVERNGIKTICYINELWHKKYTKKDEVVRNFKIIKDIYMDVINYNISSKSKFVNNEEDIKYISSNNTVESLINKINVVSNLEEDLIFNANLNLLMDKFIIDLVGGVV